MSVTHIETLKDVLRAFDERLTERIEQAASALANAESAFEKLSDLDKANTHVHPAHGVLDSIHGEKEGLKVLFTAAAHVQQCLLLADRESLEKGVFSLHAFGIDSIPSHRNQCAADSRRSDAGVFIRNHLETLLEGRGYDYRQVLRKYQVRR